MSMQVSSDYFPYTEILGSKEPKFAVALGKLYTILVCLSAIGLKYLDLYDSQFSKLFP